MKKPVEYAAGGPARQRYEVSCGGAPKSKPLLKGTGGSVQKIEYQRYGNGFRKKAC